MKTPRGHLVGAGSIAHSGRKVRTLAEDLVDRECEDLARIVEQPPEQADLALAETWKSQLRDGSPVHLIGMASLWTTKQQLARIACACVRTVLDRAPHGDDRPRRTLEVTERWADGEASLVEVWEAKRLAHASAWATGSMVSEAACEAASAAGDMGMRGLDDRAVAAAGTAVARVLDAIEQSEPTAIEAARARLVAVIERVTPPPTLAGFRAAFDERHLDGD
jgi:hypothetical protein